MFNFRLHILFIGMWLASSFLFGACSDRRELFYVTLADAAKAGEVSRGWIPDYLPVSTHTIRLAYDPSSPRTWCAFQFSPSDSQGLKKNLTSVAILPQDLQRLQGPGSSWWPAFLEGDVRLADIRANGFNAYTIEEADIPSGTAPVLFAVDWSTGRGFFFRAAHGVAGTP
jgi:hypothetical protein